MASSEVIAVIGGGSVGTAFLHHFAEALKTSRNARNLQHSQTILLFEPAELIGPGGAYADDLHTNLLNVTAGNMSIDTADPHHFLRWLAAKNILRFRDELITSETFLPRALFGLYLQDVYEAAKAKVQELGIDFVHVMDEATALRADAAKKLEITTSRGMKFPCTRAVLAIGNLPSTNFREWLRHPNYLPSPYPTSNYAKKINRSSSVAIIGTSLSAIDAIAGLLHNEHDGPIVCVSRSGRMPSVRGKKNKAVTLRPEFRAKLHEMSAGNVRISFRELTELVAEEFSAHGGQLEHVPALLNAPSDNAAYLADEIRISEREPRVWQSFCNATNDVVDTLWQLLSVEGKEQFNKDARKIWMTRRVSFPFENAKTLNSAIKDGKLKIVGGYQQMEFDDEDGQFVITFSTGTGGPAEKMNRFRCDYVINATSFSSDASRAEIPLVEDLLRSGIAISDPFGGFALETKTGRLVDKKSVAHREIYILGTLAAGTYFWTNSMDVNARLAANQAAHIALDINGSERS